MMDNQDHILIGYHLQKIRKEKGLSLEDVSKIIKIRPHLLKAIETHDPAYLPHETILKGMVFSYGRFLGIDDTFLKNIFQYELPNKRDTINIDFPEMLPKDFQVPQVPLFISILFLIILFIYRFISHDNLDIFMTNTISF